MPPFDPARPYNSLPLLPPSADIETRAILKACIGARSALAELKHIGALIPNQDVLINTIPLREAKDSSEIENVVTTGDRLFRHAGTDAAGADPATRETLRYRTALFEGYRELRTRPLTAATAVTICRTIRGIDVGFRDLPGVALKNPLTGEIIYTPPEGEPHLRDLLANWEAFLHGDSDIDPLIRMAVGHYQFEAIHPFADGNGRTGRILNILYLIERGLLQIPVLYHSAHIVRNRGPYYQLLLEVTKNSAWEAWILYMLAAVAETAQLTTRRIEAINTRMQQTDEPIRMTSLTGHSGTVKSPSLPA